MTERKVGGSLENSIAQTAGFSTLGSTAMSRSTPTSSRSAVHRDPWKTILRPLLAVLLLPLPLCAAGKWEPLWDGHSFAGWHQIGQGTWKITENAIHATHVKTETEYGHLVSDATYGDFNVRLQFKSLKGNSGLYFRITETGFSGVTGFQAEIDATKDVGGLYETNGRAWVVRPTPEAVATWFKPGEWNEMIVSAHAGHLIVRINGKISAEVPADPGRREGRFALQVHGGQDVDVWFKDLEIFRN
jgi:hypothetical protein